MEPVSASEFRDIRRKGLETDSGLRYSRDPNLEPANIGWINVLVN